LPDIDLSTRFWDKWNAEHRAADKLTNVSLDQKREVLQWLRTYGVRHSCILDVGCGTGWLCDSLQEFGQVVGTDLSRDCIRAAKQRAPRVEFHAGDFMSLDLPAENYDVIVSLEVLAHVYDQRAFANKLAALLKPGGLLILATQNKPMLQRWAIVPPPAPGQERRWLDQAEIRQLLEPSFRIVDMRTITPIAHRFPLRLLTARRVRTLIPGFTQWQEKRGWGWTIMILAQKAATGSTAPA
jgi:2-polyprenyl-3-methyl-5-hydroxy-6-metoxy-1,4-benzoquinol methylase